MAHGADIEARGHRGETPLHVAAYTNNRDIAELLILSGANLSARDGHYTGTPLHDAARMGHERLAGVLVQRGANVNARQMDGETPMRVALEAGHESLAQRLHLRYGATQ